MAPLILALDLGTSSSRAILWRGGGEVVARAQVPLGASFPRPGWVEQDPEEIWGTAVTAARQALAAAGVPAGRLAAVGLANQRETTLLWERDTGRPLHPAIVWQDRRTAPLCAELRERGLEPLFAERTGLRLDPYFSASKLAWLLEHLPGARAAARAGALCFGTVDSWFLYRATSGRVHATDVSNASRTLLWDIRRLAWDPELLHALDIPPALLPEVGPTAGPFGRLRAEVLGAEVPCTAMAGDQQAALFGQGCLAPGSAKNTYGTGAFLVAQAGPEPVRAPGLLTTVAWRLPERPTAYALEAPAFVAGAALDWLAGILGLAGGAQVAELAATVPDADGAAFVPALAGLGAPEWDPEARGLFIGLHRGTARAHLARAACEALAFQTRAATALMGEAGVAPAELRVDGGVAASDFFLALQADALGVPVVRSGAVEATAWGAALLAGVGAGLWAPEEAERGWRAGARFAPGAEAARLDRRFAAWRRAVERALGWERM